MENKIKSTILATMLIGCLAVGKEAYAIPSLQLDITPGLFNTTTETTVATGDIFTLYAYLQPDSNATLGDYYYMSAAITPKYGPTGGDLGSFTFDENIIEATGGMVYGNPPFDSGTTSTGFDPGDLSRHNIFDTYFTQFKFQFNPEQTIAAYNVQNGSSASGSMYLQAFDIDVSGLDNGYGIHFDLYNTEDRTEPVYGERTCREYYTSGSKRGQCKRWNAPIVTGYVIKDVDIISFAPYSHDAESGTSRINVPEPNSLLLLGSGLIGLVGFFRRNRK